MQCIVQHPLVLLALFYGVVLTPQKCGRHPVWWLKQKIWTHADVLGYIVIYRDIWGYMRTYADILRPRGNFFGCFDAPKVFSASNMSFPRIFDKLIWKYSQTPWICNRLTPPMKDTSEYKVYKLPAYFNHLVLHMKVHHMNTINRLGLFHFPSPLLYFLAKSIS